MQALLNSTVSQFFGHALSLTLLCTLKAALVLMATGAVAAALRNASAATRHWVWTLGLGGVLLVTVLSFSGLAWPVPWDGPDVLTTAPAVSAEANPPAPVGGSTPNASAATAQKSQPPAPASVQAPTDAGNSLPWDVFAVLLYALGALSVLLYFVVGTLRASRWSRRAEPVTDYDFLKQAEALEKKLGLSRPVRLLWCERAAMPVTWGFARPVLLLPRRAAEWSEERRRAVLIHEMAHIQRWDGLTQTIGQAACMLHWFNPLAWWAARRLRIERERACDDVVLHNGAKASSYADHLLNIARSYTATPGHPIGATSMARKSQLERRLLAILDADAHRQTLGALPALGSTVLVTALLAPLAALQPMSLSSTPSPPATTISPPPAQSSIAPPTSPAIDADTIQRSFDVKPGGTLSLRSELGSVDVETHDAATVEIVVYRKSDDGKGSEHFDVQFEQHDGGVRVRGKQREADKGWFGSSDHDLEMRYRVTTPRRYNVDLKTAGGSIQVADLDGKANVKTAGGSLRLGHIKGSVNGQTAGGSIRLAGATGNAQLKTAGGSIQGGDIDGNVRAKTAGGSIDLGRVGGTVEAKTVGGSIHVQEVAGQINAKTAGGSVTARITRQPQGDSNLKSAAGSVTVELAEDVGVDLNAKANLGHITSDFHDQGDEERTELIGPINGGGPELQLRASVGNINIRRVEAANP